MMKRSKLLSLVIIVFAISQLVYSQIPNGSWRDHYAYHKALTLAITPEKVFCGMNKGAMLSYRKSDSEIEKLSKVTGLSDIDVTALEYSAQNKTLIVGYSSGNIDLITNRGLINISDIKRKPLTNSKVINKIEAYDKYAYLACDFGIVVIDLEKIEIKDSYFFGPGGTAIRVNDITISNNYLYAATEIGLYRVDLNSPNLLDHSFWELQTDLPETNTEYKIVESFGNHIFTVYDESVSGVDKILRLTNNIWTDFVYSSDTLINSIDVINNQLCIAANTESRIYNEQLQVIAALNVSRGKALLVDSDGTIYTAGDGDGFLKHLAGEVSEIRVQAPLFNPQGQVATRDDQVWVTSGGPNNMYVEGGAHNFRDERWLSMIDGWGGNMYDVGNFYKIAYHPTNANNIFASAFTYGVWEIDNYKVVNEYRWSNTPLFQSTIDELINVRAMGLDFDRNGTLWTVFDLTDQPVYVLREGGEWENLILNTSHFKKSTHYIDLLVTKTNQVWILTKAFGIIVLQEESDGSISERTFTLRNQDNEVISQAYCLVEDKDGYVWVGTNKGPLFYPPMYDIFEREEILGNAVKIPRNDGTGLADYLLDYETINDIAVDGANRKWMATENSGAFLVSSDGLKTIHQFTFDNSPIISNNIVSVGVQENTGEVFFSTNMGLVSFMGTATEGNEEFENVYVYPNPVRPEYTGDITITGIITGANVKITDISGNLVYETTSLGGQAIWDGRNFDGNRVSTGVYLVFMTNDDGSKTHITKLLFIN